MQWAGEGIICAVRRHGDAGAIVQLLTADAGRIGGYVRGGQGRRMRPVLMAGNRVAASWRARVDDQLGSLTLELTHSLAPVLMARPVAAAAVDWVMALAAVAMPERQPYPDLWRAVLALIEAADANGPVAELAGQLAATELEVLGALGFGLDLGSCAATGVTDELSFVSPKSAQAVSRSAASGWEARLLPLPAFLLEGTPPPDVEAARAGLRLTGHFIERHLLEGAAGRIIDARHRLLRLLDS